MNQLLLPLEINLLNKDLHDIKSSNKKSDMIFFMLNSNIFYETVWSHQKPRNIILMNDTQQK